MLVTVHVSYCAGEAEAIAAMLEAQGIACHVANRHFGQVTWHYLVASGGIELQVAASEAEAASGWIYGPAAGTPATLEGEAKAFRRRFWTLGLLGLFLSLWTFVPCPLWTKARLWRPEEPTVGAAI